MLVVLSVPASMVCHLSSHEHWSKLRCITTQPCVQAGAGSGCHGGALVCGAAQPAAAHGHSGAAAVWQASWFSVRETHNPALICKLCDSAAQMAAISTHFQPCDPAAPGSGAAHCGAPASAACLNQIVSCFFLALPLASLQLIVTHLPARHAATNVRARLAAQGLVLHQPQSLASSCAEQLDEPGS